MWHGNAGWLELRTGYATCLSLSAANRSDDDGVLFLFSERACPALHDAPHAPAGSPVPLNASVEFGAWRITTRVAKSDESEPGGDQNKDALASALANLNEYLEGFVVPEEELPAAKKTKAKRAKKKAAKAKKAAADK